ncbi:rcc01693 family protein [Pseudoroseicyclus aestuarii]|uniref:Putative phage protein (TIGR02216 family) n=1 Tax=Pseudoroseicyclus aestuarii TaxID=1795041 RepID=A0A318SUY2_9RHOB|nr:rcc01693 family protein [Pseudoroseicyclus aestuarii]PYE85720.1 putative phage protein (TIGR02216 family) [Pseudoroseicyclus aestuarii]
MNWGALMRAVLHDLGLRPAEFWALTPAELRLMLGAGAAPMGRERLEELLAAYPDRGRDAKERRDDG